MKYIIHFLIVFSFFNLYSSEGIDPGLLWEETPSATNVTPSDTLTTQFSCWFVNKGAQYPFESTDFTKLTSKLVLQLNTNVLYAAGTCVLLPTVECLARLGFNLPVIPMLPFAASNVLTIVGHAFALHNKLEKIIKNINHKKLGLKNNDEIEKYLTGIQQFEGTHTSICHCEKDLKMLYKIADTSPEGQKQNQKFSQAIEVPIRIKNNILEITALTKKDYFYSALITAFFVSCASALFYKSLTAHLNMQTFGTTGITILYNWHFLYAANKNHQNHLLNNIRNGYEDFVIKVHNNQAKFYIESTVIVNILNDGLD